MAQVFQIFYSIANGLSEFNNVSLGNNKTSFALVCTDIVLLVAIDADVRGVRDTGTNRSLTDSSR